MAKTKRERETKAPAAPKPEKVNVMITYGEMGGFTGNIGRANQVLFNLFVSIKQNHRMRHYRAEFERHEKAYEMLRKQLVEDVQKSNPVPKPKKEGAPTRDEQKKITEAEEAQAVARMELLKELWEQEVEIKLDNKFKFDLQALEIALVREIEREHISAETEPDPKKRYYAPRFTQPLMDALIPFAEFIVPDDWE